MKALPVILAIHPAAEEINMYHRFMPALLCILCTTLSLFSQNVKISVKYVSAEHVYLDKGSADGITVGDRLIIGRKGRKIATVKVAYTAAHSSNCSVISSTTKIEAGDKAVLVQGGQKKINLQEKKKEQRTRKFKKSTFSKSKKRARLSGYLSAQWYQYKDLGSNHYNFQQPTLRFKLYARNFWGGHYNFRVKMRSRHNQRVRSFGRDIPQNE